MSHVCFPTISSNGTCHPRSSLLSVQCARSCALCPPSECSMAGVRAKVPSSPFHCTRSAVACRAVGKANIRPGLRPCAWSHGGGGGGGSRLLPPCAVHRHDLVTGVQTVPLSGTSQCIPPTSTVGGVVVIENKTGSYTVTATGLRQAVAEREPWAGRPPEGGGGRTSSQGLPPASASPRLPQALPLITTRASWRSARPCRLWRRCCSSWPCPCPSC